MTAEAIQVLLDWASKTNKYEQRNFAKFYTEKSEACLLEIDAKIMKEFIEEYEKLSQ